MLDISYDSDRPPEQRRAFGALVPFALAAVYLIWGSGNFALRVALETIPPFLLGATRYLFAGAILYAVLRKRGCPAPTREQWAASAKLGILFLVIGNGAVAIAGRTVPPSIVAMINATMPLMASLVAGFGKRRPGRAEVCGLALGVLGVCLLNLHGELVGYGPVLLLLFLSPLAWAVGTVWSRRMPIPGGPMATAAQLLTGGAMMLVVSVAFGERCTGGISTRAVAAFLHLSIFGSLVAFTAYGFLLRHAPPAIATSHAYVNPIIAIALGAGMAGEHPSTIMLLASGVLLSGVAVITLAQLRPAAPAAAAPEATPERRSIIDDLKAAADERLSLS